MDTSFFDHKTKLEQLQQAFNFQEKKKRRILRRAIYEELKNTGHIIGKSAKEVETGLKKLETWRLEQMYNSQMLDKVEKEEVEKKKREADKRYDELLDYLELKENTPDKLQYDDTIDYDNLQFDNIPYSTF